MRGFKPGCKKFADGGVTGQGLGFPVLRGGPIRGPGTGTSDSIKAVVPEGSFIMPADSTKQLGEENLAELGKGFKPGVPVHLSNGEYQFPPEEVYAAGVKALTKLKDATHTPTTQGVAAGFKPGTFFADGGVTLRGSNPGSLLPSERDVPTPKSLGDLFNEMTPSGRADNALAKSREGLDTSGETAAPSAPVGASAPAATAAPATASPPANPAPSSSATPSAPALPGGFKARDVGGGITKVTGGSSPLFTNTDPGQAVEQMKGLGAKPWQPQAMATQTTPSIPQGTPADAPAPGMQAASSPGLGAPVVGNGFNMRADNEARAQQNAIRESAISGGARGFSATQGPAATFNVQAEYDALKKAQDWANFGTESIMNRTARDPSGLAARAERNHGFDHRLGFLQHAMGQGQGAFNQADATAAAAQGRNAELALRYSQANATNALHRDELDLKRAAQGFQTRAALRQENLSQKYEAATTPEERAAIAQQIRDLSGKQDHANRFTVVPGGQEIDPTSNQLVTRPARVLNNQTGQFVDQPKPSGRTSPPPAAIQALKQNPNRAAEFDQKYGDGSSSIYLNG